MHYVPANNALPMFMCKQSLSNIYDKNDIYTTIPLTSNVINQPRHVW